MTKIALLLMMSLVVVSCNGNLGKLECEKEDQSTTTTCDDPNLPPIESEPGDAGGGEVAGGEVGGGSTGGTSGEASGGVTGGTSGGVTGGTSGGVTGGMTGGTSGGTTTGGTSGGTTTGDTSGGTTTGGTSGGTTTGGTSGGTTTGGTSGGSSGGGTLPTAAYTFDTNITYVNFTSAQHAKYEQAVELVKEVVATEAFKSRILNHTYNGVKTFVDNGGFSNAQIYQKILDAAETLQPAKNNRMDLEVELYYAATTTVGYTYANSKRIWVNTKYFNTYSIPQVANNLFHEWLHKLGFGHAASYSVSRDYSVPYAIGDIVESIGRTL